MLIAPSEPRVFWEKLEWRGECLLWLGGPSAPYGQAFYRGRQIGAHRLAWCLANGVDPTSLGRFDFVCHRCDNKRCCRPDHLYLGTPRQNTRDSVERGLHPAGARGGGAKLTESEVRAVHDAPGRQRDIARQWGIAQSHVGRIKRREVWKEIWC